MSQETVSEIPATELQRARFLCKGIREATQRAIDDILPKYIELGKFVKKWTEAGISVNQLAKQLNEPGFSKATLVYAQKLVNALTTFYAGDMHRMLEDLKARLGEPLSWRRVINGFLVQERKKRPETTAIQETAPSSETEKPVIQEVGGPSEGHETTGVQGESRVSESPSFGPVETREESASSLEHEVSANSSGHGGVAKRAPIVVKEPMRAEKSYRIPRVLEEFKNELLTELLSFITREVWSEKLHSKLSDGIERIIEDRFENAAAFIQDEISKLDPESVGELAARIKGAANMLQQDILLTLRRRRLIITNEDWKAVEEEVGFLFQKFWEKVEDHIREVLS